MHRRVSWSSSVQFCRMLVIFVVFELELILLILVAPLVSMLSVTSLCSVFVFLFVVQWVMVGELRSGFFRWVSA